ncbi:MAG: hypothetical protein EA378_01350 [Phycisphaerales bacterium]|nr:MAG: hypothetical protein EA378_01350 [Phycisphaerales bacterium]
MDQGRARAAGLVRAGWIGTAAALAIGASATAHTPFAVEVTEYIVGSGVNPAFTDSNSALGSPSRFTGIPAGFPSVVSPFSAPFDNDQLVQIGEGGSLTLRLGTRAWNDPSNPFGVDLIVFGNGSLIDTAFPNGVAGTPAAAFGLDPMVVEVSANGVDFISLGTFTEGLFPTMGFQDGGPFDSTPGSVPTSFTTPVNPALTLADFSGLDMDGIRALYNGSGGGTPIDIAASGLDFVDYIRIVNPLGSGITVEIDAVSVVPTPGGGVVIMLAGLACTARRRRA